MKFLIKLFLAFVGAVSLFILFIAALAPNTDNGSLIIIPIAILFFSVAVVVINRLIRWLW